MDFLDETMDELVRARFDAHLRHCPNCEAFLDQYRDTIYLAKEGRDVEIPYELVRRTIDFLQDHYDDM